jgi:hypothetical protein
MRIVAVNNGGLGRTTKAAISDYTPFDCQKSKKHFLILSYSKSMPFPGPHRATYGARYCITGTFDRFERGTRESVPLKRAAVADRSHYAKHTVLKTYEH